MSGAEDLYGPADAVLFGEGDFVTAHLAGEDKTAIRQGIVTLINADGSFRLLGESGAVYRCDGSPTRVPDSNLYGSTLRFVEAWRAARGGRAVNEHMDRVSASLEYGVVPVGRGFLVCFRHDPKEAWTQVLGTKTYWTREEADEVKRFCEEGK